MSVDRDALLAANFETVPFEGREKLSGKRPLSLRVSERGLHFVYFRSTEIFVPIEAVKGWEFCDSYVLFTYQGKELLLKKPPEGDCQEADFCEANEVTIAVKMDAEAVQVLRKQFNLLRLRHYLKTLSPSEQEKKEIRQCPVCHLLYNATEARNSSVTYCPECLSITHEDEDLTTDGSASFNYCENGFFMQIGSETRKERFRLQDGDAYCFHSLQSENRPLLDKMLSHILWMALWVTGLALLWYPFTWGWWGDPASHQLLSSFITSSVYTLLTLFFFSFLMLGYYLTGLMIYGGTKSLLRPPLWEKITRIIRKGKLQEAEALLQKHNLQDHPSLMSNLALGYFFKGDHSKGWQLLQQAIALCNNHPALICLAQKHCPPDQRPLWDNRWQQLLNENELIPLETYTKTS